MAKNKYSTHIEPYLEKIAAWVRDGATEKEIANNLGIAESTFRKYLTAGRNGDKKYAALSDTFDSASEEPNAKVEAALYKSATGYDVTVTKHYKIRRVEYNPETGRKVSEREELKEVEERIHVAANVMAQQFWLVNRCPERWQYKPEAVTDGTDEDGVVEIPAAIGFALPGEADE